MSIFKKGFFPTNTAASSLLKTSTTSIVSETLSVNTKYVEQEITKAIEQSLDLSADTSLNLEQIKEAIQTGVENAKISEGIRATTTEPSSGAGTRTTTTSTSRMPDINLGITPEQLASIISTNCEVNINTVDRDISNFLGESGIGRGVGRGVDFTGTIPANLPGGLGTDFGIGTGRGRPDVTNFQIDNFLDPKKGGIKKEEENLDTITNFTFDSGFDPRGIISDNIPAEQTGQLNISSGKREFYILEDLIGPRFDTFMNSNPLSSNDIFLKDPLRGRSGSYWSLGRNLKNLLFLSQSKRIRSKRLFKNFRFNVFNKLFNKESPTDIGFVEENFIIDFDDKMFVTSYIGRNSTPSKTLIDAFSYGGSYEGPTKFDNQIDFDYVPTFRVAVPFYDLVYTRYLPYTLKELEKVEVPISSTTIDIKTDYNFYIKDYEELIENNSVVENILPNFYVMLSQQKFERPNPDYNKLITLDGLLSTKAALLLRTRKYQVKKNLFDIKKASGQYYDLYSRAYKRLEKNQQKIDSLSAKMNNLVISKNDLDLIKKFNSKKEMFPMNIDISFTTDKTTKLCGILSETNLTDVFVTKIVNKIIENKYINFSFFKESLGNLEEDVIISQEAKRGWNLLDLMSEIEDLGKFEDLNPNNAIYVGEYENYRKSLNTEKNKFFNSLNLAILKNKLITFSENNMRTYNDIVNGKKAYSETLMYRIAKYVGESTLGEPIQNIYIPNDPDLDILNYVDTQVKYDTKYTYVIYTYDFVLGSQYSYESVVDSNTDITKKIVNVKTMPYMTIIESEFYKKTCLILDKPPSQPEITVAPYKDVDNKLLFLLNGSISEHVALPVIIDVDDVKKFEKIRVNQELEIGEKIKFGGDDRTELFEIYRIDYHPSSYADFNRKLISSLSTDYSSATIQQANSAAFIDTLEPNKKYYYIFRSYDVHGNISNPSELLEVEIINENGTIFPIIKNIDFKVPDDRRITRSLKRFIYLQPNVAQSLYIAPDSDVEVTSAEQVKNGVKLGIAENSIWGKKVKLRLVSKNTKKVLDFVVKFDHKNYDLVEK